jgi:hypothetical protein
MKDCPACGASVPKSANRCKDCFHDFDEDVGKRKDGPIFLLGAFAIMAIIGAGVLWYVAGNPVEERILVDEQTRSIIWTRVYNGNRLETERLMWTDVAKLEYVVLSAGYEINAVAMAGERHIIQESPTSLKSEADRYSQMMEKPLDIVDNTRGFDAD